MPNRINLGPQPAEYIALRWVGGEALLILDQRLLPQQEVYIEARTPEVVAEAIKTMQVRGAPAIGVAAAFGMVLAAQRGADLQQAHDLLWATRPTARNLFWALARMMECATGDDLAATLEKEALAIQQEDYLACRTMGEFGAALLPGRCRVLTHCNAGALATAGWGTALGVIRSAHLQGKIEHVYADETRPLLQGSRLTAWEMKREGIPVTVLPDSAAGLAMRRGMIDAVVVGADRIAHNGDVVNKVGTYHVALLAKEHGVPFYVAAPISTFDLSLANGESIPIEERAHSEVLQVGDQCLSAADQAFNPAFDITPARLVRAIICEKGVYYPPYEANW